MKISKIWKKSPVKTPHAAKQQQIDDPAAHFATPARVLESKTLSANEKGAALKTWAEDAGRLSVAADEGMTGGERSVLPDVKAAEAVLEQQIKEQAAASKSGSAHKK